MADNLAISQKSQNYLRRYIIVITLEYKFTKNYGRWLGGFPKISNIICDNSKKSVDANNNHRTFQEYFKNNFNVDKWDGFVLCLFTTTFGMTCAIANTNRF